MDYRRLSVDELLTNKLEAKALHLGGDPANGTAGTLVSASAAEVNKLTGATVTTQELNLLDGAVAGFTLAAAAGAANVCEITVTARDAAGAAVAAVVNFLLWLSDAATGAGLTGTAASGNVEAKAASGVVLSALTAKKAFLVQTKADGTFVLSITDTAKTAFYPCAQTPLGRVVVGDQLETADYGA